MSLLDYVMPWDFSPAILVACGLPALLYLRGLARGRRPGFWRALAFFLGILLMYAVTQTRYDYYSVHMFWVHRLQHMVLHHLAPLLLVLSAPGAVLAAGTPRSFLTWARALGRSAWVRYPYAVLQHPLIAPLLFVGLIFFWLTPTIHFDAMLSRWLYAVMNWSMALDGLLFWWFLLDPQSRRGYGMRIGIALGVMFPQILLGAYMTFSRQVLFEVYAVCGRAWPISPMVDQNLGGLITWIPPAMMSVLGALILLHRAMHDSAAASGTAVESSEL